MPATLKAFDEYRLCSDEWITCVSVYATIGGNPSILYSQSLSATPLIPWVGVKRDRCIIVAHCTCMAGIREACSHVAGLLLTLEANT